MPHYLSDLGQLQFLFSLDFGSFRDLQRHRNGVCRMPLLEAGTFETWYMEQLPADLRIEAEELVAEQRAAIEALTDDKVARQYYCALGFRVPCAITYGLPAALYVVELRSQRSVHPTLRAKAREMATQIRRALPGVAIHTDESPDDWDVRRGAQTISPIL